MKTQENTQSEEKNLQELLASDPKLREDLMKSPQAVLESIQGLQPGELDGVDIRPVPVFQNTILITLPDKNYQLSDDELEPIAAGFSFVQEQQARWQRYQTDLNKRRDKALQNVQRIRLSRGIS